MSKRVSEQMLKKIQQGFNEIAAKADISGIILYVCVHAGRWIQQLGQTFTIIRASPRRCRRPSYALYDRIYVSKESYTTWLISSPRRSAS